MFKLYKRLFEIVYKHKLHHLGSYVTTLKIVDEIYSLMEERDIFIMSCGHSVLSLYIVLEKYFGTNAETLLKKYGEHPKFNKKDRIDCSTGSLGLGITIAVGRAIADRNRKVYCLISDGECAEGSVWESLRFAYENHLDNLIIYVNVNGFSAYDKIDIDYLERRLVSFNPDVKIIKTNNMFSFLSGIHAHYAGITEETYKTALEELNEKNF